MPENIVPRQFPIKISANFPSFIVKSHNFPVYKFSPNFAIVNKPIPNNRLPTTPPTDKYMIAARAIKHPAKKLDTIVVLLK